MNKIDRILLPLNKSEHSYEKSIQNLYLIVWWRLIQHDDSIIVSEKSMIKVVLENLCVRKKMVMEEEGEEEKSRSFSMKKEMLR